MLSFDQALAIVKEKLSEAQPSPAIEVLPLDQVPGRVLAEDVFADRDYPPFHRAIRDGYALRSIDLGTVPAVLERVGQVRAGEYWPGALGPGQCIEIMTGAPVPEGADAVAMIEHVREGEHEVEVPRALRPFENVVRKGSEATSGSRVLPRGRRLSAAEIGLLAAVGRAQVRVFVKPRVAILATGDEIVPVEQQPEWFQVRNSNAVTLGAQVAAAGGVPEILASAPDEKEALHRLIVEGFAADLLLLSGGVSVGKYDFVKQVLNELGAEFYFQGVAIRPGRPLTFGRVRGKFFFGLPGNPVSTFVTFELFARPAIALLAGGEFEVAAFLRARLAKPYQQKTGLTAFMPARVESEEGAPVVRLVGWQGSGDLVGVAAANCFLVVHPEQTDLAAGDWVDVLKL
jgi:molybdopterin molybdotransferase